MDLLGVMILGLITAVGGGVLRDLLLGITPPKVFDDPLTVCVALVSSAAAFLPPLRGLLLRSTLLFERLLLWADSLGLAAFTVVGEQIAYSHLPEEAGLPWPCWDHYRRGRRCGAGFPGG